MSENKEIDELLMQLKQTPRDDLIRAALKGTLDDAGFEIVHVAEGWDNVPRENQGFTVNTGDQYLVVLKPRYEFPKLEWVRLYPRDVIHAIGRSALSAIEVPDMTPSGSSIVHNAYDLMQILRALLQSDSAFRDCDNRQYIDIPVPSFMGDDFYQGMRITLGMTDWDIPATLHTNDGLRGVQIPSLSSVGFASALPRSPNMLVKIFNSPRNREGVVGKLKFAARNGSEFRQQLEYYLEKAPISASNFREPDVREFLFDSLEYAANILGDGKLSPALIKFAKIMRI